MNTEDQIKEKENELVRSYGRGSTYFLLTKDLSGEDDKWMYSREFYKKLRELGLTHHDWCDKYILGINSPEERPKCSYPGCNNTAVFNYKVRRYGKFCGLKCQLNYIQYDEECNKKKAANIALAYDKNPDLRSYRSKIMTDTNLRLWKDPSSAFNSIEYRNMRSEAAHQIFSRPRSEAFKEVKRNEMIKRLMDHPDTVHSLGLHGYYTPLKCRNKSSIFYRSSYELTYLQLLDSNNEVLFYEWEPIRIDYEYGAYVPDVLVYYNNKVELQEIKASWRLTDEVVMMKAQAAIKYCSEHNMTYRFITEDDIF